METLKLSDLIPAVPINSFEALKNLLWRLTLCELTLCHTKENTWFLTYSTDVSEDGYDRARDLAAKHITAAKRLLRRLTLAQELHRLAQI